jgi:hypothetical protein
MGNRFAIALLTSKGHLVTNATAQYVAAYTKWCYDLPKKEGY